MLCLGNRRHLYTPRGDGQKRGFSGIFSPFSSARPCLESLPWHPQCLFGGVCRQLLRLWRWGRWEDTGTPLEPGKERQNFTSFVSASLVGQWLKHPKPAQKGRVETTRAAPRMRLGRRVRGSPKSVEFQVGY